MQLHCVSRWNVYIIVGHHQDLALGLTQHQDQWIPDYFFRMNNANEQLNRPLITI